MLFIGHQLRERVARASMPTRRRRQAGEPEEQQVAQGRDHPQRQGDQQGGIGAKVLLEAQHQDRLADADAGRRPRYHEPRPPSERQRRDGAEEVDRLRARRRGCRRDQSRGSGRRWRRTPGVAVRPWPSAAPTTAARRGCTARLRACRVLRRRLTPGAARRRRRPWPPPARRAAAPGRGPARARAGVARAVPATASRSTVSASEARASAPCPWPSRRPRSCRPTK